MALGFAQSLNLSESSTATRDNLILDNLYGDGSIFRDIQLFRNNLKNKSTINPGEYTIEYDSYDLNQDGDDEDLYYFKVGQLIKLLRSKPERIIFSNFSLANQGTDEETDFYLLQIGEKKFASSTGVFATLSDLRDNLQLKLSNDPEINANYTLKVVSFENSFGGTTETPVEKMVLQWNYNGDQTNIPYILTYEGLGNGLDDSQPIIENGATNQVLLAGTPVDEGLESVTTDTNVYTLVPPFSNKTTVTVYDTNNENAILGLFEVFDSNAVDRFRLRNKDNNQQIIPNSPAEVGRYIIERSDAIFRNNITNLQRDRLETFVSDSTDEFVEGQVTESGAGISVLNDKTIGGYISTISIGTNILNLKKALTPKRDVDNIFQRSITFANSVRIINDDNVQTEEAPGLFIVTDDGTPRGAALRAFSDLSNPWFEVPNDAGTAPTVEGQATFDADVGEHLLTLASSAGIGKLTINSDGLVNSVTPKFIGNWTKNNYGAESTPIDVSTAGFKLEVLIRTPDDPEGETFSLLLAEVLSD